MLISILGSLYGLGKLYRYFGFEFLNIYNPILGNSMFGVIVDGVGVISVVTVFYLIAFTAFFFVYKLGEMFLELFEKENSK